MAEFQDESDDGDGDRLAWGEPPDAELMGKLLRERWKIPRSEHLAVQVDEKARAIGMVLRSGRVEFRFRVAYERGAGRREPWSLIVDALDALFGTFEESGRNDRDLPSGPDVEHAGAFFFVARERVIPDLEKLAHQILERAGERSD